MQKPKRWVKNSLKQAAYSQLKLNCEKNLSGALDDWNWPILGHVTSTSLIKLFALKDCYLSIIDTPGAIIELGSFFGTNALIFQNLKYIFEPHNDRQILVFDQFKLNETAIPSSDEFNYFTYPGATDDLLATSETHHTISAGPFKSPFVTWVDGDIATTLPNQLAKDSDLTIALLYIDLDKPCITQFSLNSICDRLSPNSLVVIEGFMNTNTKGVAKSIRDFFQKQRGVSDFKRLEMTNYLVSFRILS